jgi:hypothetical protein
MPTSSSRVVPTSPVPMSSRRARATPARARAASGVAAAAVAGAASAHASPAFSAEEPALNGGWPLPADRVQADLLQLNLSFLHLAREAARSARDVAITRFGLDAEACAALERLSMADLQAIAQSQALVFGLRVEPRALAAHAALARNNPVASEARLLLAAYRA